jgi:phosphate uptake regulator
MDRISALRNVEEALEAFESGDDDLATTERRVRTVLQTYATEFEDENRAVYRTATGDDPTVVVAASAAEARERIADLTGEEPGDVERLE